MTVPLYKPVSRSMTMHGLFVLLVGAVAQAVMLLGWITLDESTLITKNAADIATLALELAGVVIAAIGRWRADTPLRIGGG
jgi:uncharacterized membrane protein (UPF0182 family)